MDPIEHIGRNVQYWGKTAQKPNPGLIVDVQGDDVKLVVFTESGGRFTTDWISRRGNSGEGWTEVGQTFR